MSRFQKPNYIKMLAKSGKKCPGGPVIDINEELNGIGPKPN